jgi:hypothetical protein
MTNQNPLKSKKFIAYLIADIGWKLLLVYMLFQLKGKYDYYSFFITLTLVITTGFIQVGYILGQASLDKYTKMVETTQKVKND